MKKTLIPDSIKWRLPLSYAGIALLVALALGAVLILTIRDYYGQREYNYLNSNARAIANALAVTASGETLDADRPARDAQVSSLSFLSQAHIRLLNTQDEVIADSGPPAPRAISLSRQFATFNAPLPPIPPGSSASESVTTHITETVSIKKQPLILVYITNDNSDAMGQSGILISKTLNQVSRTVNGSTLTQALSSDVLYTLPASGTPFGFGLSEDIEQDGRRSPLVVRVDMHDQVGRLTGYVELSEGPAYGGQIVDSVARGWAIASVIAVLLAIGVGVLISLRVSTPLVNLTAVTARMAEGDLSARADVERGDELGTLAHSFNDMAGRVEETVHELRRFIGDAAHELNTPLTALRTNLELSMDEEAAATRQRFSGLALQQLERLQGLTSSMLDLSRIESRTANDSARVNLADLVSQTSETFASRAEQAGIAFRLSISSPDIAVQGDAGRLRGAVINLLDNALKFTPRGGGVDVALEADSTRATLSITDTGIGIPAEDVPLLFSRFHRGRNTATYPGSGLGLAIVKAIADAHGGTVAYISTGESGACFTLSLPLIP